MVHIRRIGSMVYRRCSCSVVERGMDGIKGLGEAGVPSLELQARPGRLSFSRSRAVITRGH